MSIPFLIIAAVMVVAALLFALVPMLRHAQRAPVRPHAPFWIALVLVLLMPPAVFGAYLLIGTPQALRPAPVDSQATLVDATAQLRASLDKKPDDAHGWALLSQAYSALNEPQQALDALNHLIKLKPDDPDALVAWVEASAAVDPTHQIGDASRAKLAHALQIDPTHQRALWLLGVSDFQRQQFADAAKEWQTLLPLLKPGSRVAATVEQQLAEARQRAGEPAAAASTAGAAASAVALNITVKLAPSLAAQLQPGSALFVFARAVDGPAMPLAVAKLQASRGPVQVTLTNAMAMTPGLDLAKYPKVQVAARISRSGNAMPAAGDLESAPVVVATDSRAPIALTIDKVD